MRLAALVLGALAASAGCSIGYKSTAGGATSPDGFGRGTTRSLQFQDQGGILSRLGLATLGVGLAAGAVENRQVTSNTWTSGDRQITETTASGTVNQGTAQGATDIVNTAADPKAKLTSVSGGLAARLEIASRSFGGDTSGWQYDMGYAFRRMGRLGPAGYMLRGYVGAGYGSFTMHERVMTRIDRGPPEFGEGDYSFLGATARVGLFLIKPFRSFSGMMGTESFARLSANASGPSYVAVGQRLQWTLVYVELEMMLNGSTDDDRSYAIEVGVGF